MQPHPKKLNERLQGLLKWVIFGVIIALAPLGASFLNAVTDETSSAWLTVGKQVLAEGELLLIAAAIAADAIGDLIGSGRDDLTLKLLSGGACVLVVFVASLWYGHIAALVHAGKTPQTNLVPVGSLLVLAGTVLATGVAKFVAEV